MEMIKPTPTTGRRIAWVMLIAGAFAMGSEAIAQSAATPFYFDQPTSIEAEIGVVATGVSQTVSRAEVVGPDRRYVTLDMNAESDAFLGFRTFSFSGPAGFVGSPAAQQAVANAAARSAGAGGSASLSTPARQAPAARSPTILDRRGMTLIQPLRPPGSGD